MLQSTGSGVEIVWCVKVKMCEKCGNSAKKGKIGERERARVDCFSGSLPLFGYNITYIFYTLRIRYTACDFQHGPHALTALTVFHVAL